MWPMLTGGRCESQPRPSSLTTSQNWSHRHPGCAHGNDGAGSSHAASCCVMLCRAVGPSVSPAAVVSCPAISIVIRSSLSCLLLISSPGAAAAVQQQYSSSTAAAVRTGVALHTDPICQHEDPPSQHHSLQHPRHSPTTPTRLSSFAHTHTLSHSHSHPHFHFHCYSHSHPHCHSFSLTRCEQEVQYAGVLLTQELLTELLVLLLNQLLALGYQLIKGKVDDLGAECWCVCVCGQGS